jgi:hypothetical protein
VGDELGDAWRGTRHGGGLTVRHGRPKLPQASGSVKAAPFLNSCPGLASHVVTR